MAVFKEILHVEAGACAVTAETVNCARAHETASLLLSCHQETMITPMHMHTCILYVNLPFNFEGLELRLDTATNFQICLEH